MNKLTIWVDAQWRSHPAILELEAKGHAIWAPADKPDLILHPQAWNWNDGMWQYLPIALKQARKEGRLKLEGIKRDDSSRKGSGSDGKDSKRARKPRTKSSGSRAKPDSSNGEAAS
jgi:hypothetical protein